jgi:hypothetical protein
MTVGHDLDELLKAFEAALSVDLHATTVTLNL